jgi:hypothetical protein
MRDMTAVMGEDMDGDMEQMLEEGGASPAEDSPED